MDREITHYLVSQVIIMAESALDQRQEPGTLDLHHGQQGPDTGTIFCCFPKHINRDIDQRWGSQGKKWLE